VERGREVVEPLVPVSQPCPESPQRITRPGAGVAQPGVCIDNIDLEGGTLEVFSTRVVVDGRTEDEDGKTEAGRRIVALDALTVAALRKHLEMLDEERSAFGRAYPQHGALFVWADGKRVHPQTITNRFNTLVDTAGARRIRLHDVRHTYATLALDSGVEPKILSDRVGHSNMSVTFQVYAHRSTGHDRVAADLIGGLIRDALDEPEPPSETA
jgi:integrase